MRHMIRAKHNPTDHEQREKERAIALAAMVQSACLVERLAQRGQLDTHSFEQSMDALLDQNYINERTFFLGSSKLKNLLSGHDITHARNIISHTGTLMRIEKKLSQDKLMLQQLADGMSRIHQQAQYFGSPYHDNIISAVAHVYNETISTLTPRVIIRGKTEFLKQPQHTQRIRCLLLSGVRAAWVWRILGGNSIRLIFNRRQIIKHLNHNPDA